MTKSAAVRLIRAAEGRLFKARQKLDAALVDAMEAERVVYELTRFGYADDAKTIVAKPPRGSFRLRPGKRITDPATIAWVDRVFLKGRLIREDMMQ